MFGDDGARFVGGKNGYSVQCGTEWDRVRENGCGMVSRLNTRERRKDIVGEGERERECMMRQPESRRMKFHRGNSIKSNIPKGRIPGEKAVAR